MDNSDILLYGMSDAALLENIGRFITCHSKKPLIRNF